MTGLNKTEEEEAGDIKALVLILKKSHFSISVVFSLDLKKCVVMCTNHIKFFVSLNIQLQKTNK